MSGGKLDRLEQLRGAASFYVLLHHYVRHNLPEAPGVARFFVFGQVAVLLFFLLSGFVIHYSALRRGKLNARDYFVRRIRRIYPVFLIALALSYLAACHQAGAWLGPDLRSLGLNLLQLQGLDRDAGQWVDTYMGNEPLWSLSYEWWFYLAFFFVFRMRPDRPHRRRRLAWLIAAAGLLSDLVWPNPLSLIASYFALWWVGAELATQWVEQGRVTLKRQAPALLGAVSITAGWVLVAALQASQTGSFDMYHHPGITARHFLTTLAVIGIGWTWIRLGGWGLETLLRPFGRVAPFSYALYVLHLPFIFIAKSFSTGYGLLDLLWIVPILFALCWAIEQPLQQRINRWTNRLLTPRSPAREGSKASAPGP